MNRTYKLTLHRKESKEESYEHVYLSVSRKGELSIARDDITPEGSSKLEEITEKEGRKTNPAYPPISFRDLYDWKPRLFRILFGI